LANYLVTGGCGFIGSHLVESLVEDGHRVRVLDNLSTGKRENLPSDIELVVGDVADENLVSFCMIDMDGCFHLAAVASVQRSVEYWLDAHRTNLTGAIAVLDASRPREGRAPRPVVLASSAAVFGANSTLPLRETSATAPLSAYGADKLGCELHGRVAASAFGIPVTALRFFNVYGPRQDPKSPYSGVISVFSERISSELPVTIFGDGQQSRDFVYVGDVVRLLRAAMKKPQPLFRVFNVCTGRATTLLELVDTLAALRGVTAKIEFRSPRVGDIRQSLGDPAAAAAELDVAPEVELREGLARTLAYIVGSHGSANEG
jgi:UDP-glucose 4-epimerase